jgi:hypothetical protein
MKTLIVVLLAFCASGCSIGGRYYLRNLSDRPAVVSIVLDDSTALDKSGNISFKYDDTVRDIKFRTFEYLVKDLEVRLVDDTRMEFTVPPESTVFIGIGGNGQFAGFQQASILVGDKVETLTINDMNQMKFGTSGLGKYAVYYDITL